MGELAGLGEAQDLSGLWEEAVATSLREAASRYQADPTATRAAEMVGVALVLQEPTAGPDEEGVSLIANDEKLAWVLDDLENLRKGGRRPDREDEGFAASFSRSANRIARLRAILEQEPRNAVRWMDLALEHTIRGNIRSARRAVMTATNLAGTNRFVIRSAARFYVHIGEPDRAHWLLERAGRAASDPWVAAAAVSVADFLDVSSRHRRAARWLVREAGLFPWHVSELSGALATDEWRAGSDRRARQFMKQALDHPNENVLAQAEWAHERGLIRESDELSMASAPFPYEAMARHEAYLLNWREAIVGAERWLSDQPFSVDAATFGSWVASQDGDYKASAEFCRDGLLANARSVLLMNNLAYAEACQDNLEEAAVWLKRARSFGSIPREQALLAATAGLVLFRSGDAEGGRQLYETAISAFHRLGERTAAAMATLLLAEAELIAGTHSAMVALARARDVASASGAHFVRARLANRTELLLESARESTFKE